MAAEERCKVSACPICASVDFARIRPKGPHALDVTCSACGWNYTSEGNRFELRDYLRIGEAFDRAQGVILDRCPDCAAPAHASETDDAGRCAECAGRS